MLKVRPASAGDGPDACHSPTLSPPALLPRKPSQHRDRPLPRPPTTPAGKARSARNATCHGLRAHSLTPVAALGETPELLATHVKTHRRGFPAPGAYALAATD